jgi:Flp pilus assembly protein TadD
MVRVTRVENFYSRAQKRTIRNMQRHAVVGILLVALAACTSAPRPSAHPDHAPLLDGRALFGGEVAPADEVDILAVSDDMRAFVAANGGSQQVDSLRMKRLMIGMQNSGLLSLQYENNRTLTAAQTFAARSGNCLSFTNLFVALARTANLDAQYQVVDVPPMWDSIDGWIIRNGHIDVVLRGVRMGSTAGGTVFRRDYVVDFNMADFQTAYPRRVVKDRTAFALFYSNRGVEALRAGDVQTAFANFKLALAKDARESSVWVNLGALYARQGRYDYAQVAYEQALMVEPSDKSAMTNLARLFDKLGNPTSAQEYRTRIAHYESINPYYHYALAERAYESTDYRVALDEIKRAIALKADDHRFFFLEGLVQYKLGNIGDARSSLSVAERLSDEDAVKQRYASKLAALGLKNG